MEIVRSHNGGDQLVTACLVGMLLKGEDLGSSLTNNLIMEIVRSHNGGVGVGALQRCELGSTGRWFRRTGCYIKVDFSCDNPSRGTPIHGPQGEDLGSSLTNNLIMEIVRSHNRGIGVGALQRCKPGVHGQVFHGTGCHNKAAGFGMFDLSGVM
ncbi:Uncharacterized protein Rs2_30170 [Raphanus sativus]|nr:Uncharacterized protein Rs2_30170 [Raphanus sativus]